MRHLALALALCSILLGCDGTLSGSDPSDGGARDARALDAARGSLDAAGLDAPGLDAAEDDIVFFPGTFGSALGLLGWTRRKAK